MNNYIRKVNYHETDKMGITHHSNYIKWMEEARVDFLEQIGCGYDKLEAQGIISPVVNVNCSYKQPTTFGDTVSVRVRLTEYHGVKFVFDYEMTNQKTGAVVCAAQSTHCFVNEQGRPIALKKQHPQLDAVLKGLLEE